MVREVLSVSCSGSVVGTDAASASGGSLSSNPAQSPLLPVAAKGKGKRGRKSLKDAANDDADTISCDIIKVPKTVPEKCPGRWTNQLQFIKETVMKALMRHKSVKMFKDPINPVRMGIPNYYDYVDRPMDLTTIRSRLNNRYYQNGADECLQDFQLMFCNCYLYNKPDTFVTEDANDLECLLLRKLLEMPEPEETIKPGGGSSTRSISISESCDAVDGGGERSEDQKEEESDAGSRKSLRVKQVKEKAVPEPGQGSGGKVLRPPEKKRNDDSSSSSSEDEPEEDKSDVTSSSANEHESSEDDAVDDGIGTDASRTEQLKFLRIVQQRRKKYLKLLQSQLNNVNQQMAAIRQDEKEDAEKIKKLTAGTSDTSTMGGGRKSSKKKFSTFASSAKRKAPMKKTTKTPANKKATPKKKPSPVEVATSSSSTFTIRVPTASSSKKRPCSAASNDDASDPKGNSPSPVKLPPPKKAKVSTSRSSSVMTPPPPPSPPTTASPKKADDKSRGRGRPSGSTKKAATPKAPELPSTSRASTATARPRPPPLTTQQIEALNIQVNMLDEEPLLEMLQMVSPFDDGSGTNVDFAKLPPVCQWQLKTFVEKNLEKQKGKKMEVSKSAKVPTPVSTPQQSKKKVEKKEANTLTFHAVLPSPVPSPSPPDVPSSSSSSSKKDITPQRTPPTVMDNDSDDESRDSSSDEDLFTVVPCSSAPSRKKVEEKATPPPATKTLTEEVEEELDYGDGEDVDEEELLDVY